MGMITVRPVATYSGSNWTKSGGYEGSTYHGILADNSDASYIYANTLDTAKNTWVLVATPAIPANAVITSVQTRIRLNSAAGYSTIMRIGYYGADSVTTYETFVAPTSTITTGGAVRTRTPNGAVWTMADVAATWSWIHPYGNYYSGNLNVFELYNDVFYNEAPVVTTTAPTGVIGQSSPSFTWTYTDPEGDPITRIAIKVFSAAQYNAAGFNPSTSMWTWASGEKTVSGGTTTYVSPGGSLVLPNGDYRAYIAVSDAGSDLGRGPGFYRWSAWSYSSFTVSVVPPVVPVLTATQETF